MQTLDTDAIFWRVFGILTAAYAVAMIGSAVALIVPATASNIAALSFLSSLAFYSTIGYAGALLALLPFVAALEWCQSRIQTRRQQSDRQSDRQSRQRPPATAPALYVVLLCAVALAALLTSLYVTRQQSPEPQPQHHTPATAEPPEVYYLAHCTLSGTYNLVMTDSNAVATAERDYGYWPIPETFYQSILTYPTTPCVQGPQDMGKP